MRVVITVKKHRVRRIASAEALKIGTHPIDQAGVHLLEN